MPPSKRWQEPNTLRALERARSEGLIRPADGDRVIANYRRLRRIEAILRRWSYEGETELPDDPAAFRRVALRCGFLDAADFRDAVARYRTALRGVYQSVMAPADGA